MNMEKLKDLLKEIKPADIIIVLGIVIAMLVGMLTFYHFRGTADKKIEAFIRGVTLTGNEVPIKAGDETFITIRNVPYTNLKVLDTKIDTKKIVVPNPRRGKDDFLVIDDSSQAFLYDMIVTLVVNDAKITKDGAVAGGNKIKIGLQYRWVESYCESIFQTKADSFLFYLLWNLSAYSSFYICKAFSTAGYTRGSEYASGRTRFYC